MVVRCDFVDPDDNFPCGKKTQLTRIVIQYPNRKDIVIKHACKIHGDKRFNRLSASEISITKKKDTNKISYHEFAEEMKSIRWKKCRSCNGDFAETDTGCCMTYFWLNENNISLRRSFQLHDDCLASELKFFEIQKKNNTKTLTLDSIFKEPLVVE